MGDGQTFRYAYFRDGEAIRENQITDPNGLETYVQVRCWGLPAMATRASRRAAVKTIQSTRVSQSEQPWRFRNGDTVYRGCIHSNLKPAMAR